MLYRFKRALEEGYVPAEVADRVAGRLVKDYGDEMAAGERERVRWLGDEGIIALTESYNREDPKLREARLFKNTDLSAADYAKLSDAKEREFYREKVRRIRAARREYRRVDPPDPSEREVYYRD